MSDHIPGVTKMIGETPRTNLEAFFPHESMYQVCDADFTRRLERELNRACEMYRKLDIHALNLVDMIMRLEKAGDAVEERLGCGCGCGGPCKACQSASENWFKAKEAKP